MSDFHVWSTALVVAVLVCLSAFFYFRSRNYREEASYLSDQYRELQITVDQQSLPANMEERLAQKEAQIRAQYEARDAAMTNELNRLYDLEREVRIVTGLPSRPEMSSAGAAAVDSGAAPVDTENGQGGPPDDPDAGAVFDDTGINPPALIAGLSNPSADLILEEMRLRMESMGSLLKDARAQRLRLAHTPSVWPTNDARRTVTSKFGMRRDPFTKKWRHHSGLDIRATYGSPVLSTAEGTVIFSGYQQYLGHAVKIDHGYGIETWYGHLSKRLVEVGDHVKRGDVIGKVGSSGRSTGPHIHYEVHVGGKRVDPREYIGR